MINPTGQFLQERPLQGSSPFALGSCKLHTQNTPQFVFPNLLLAPPYAPMQATQVPPTSSPSSPPALPNALPSAFVPPQAHLCYYGPLTLMFSVGASSTSHCPTTVPPTAVHQQPDNPSLSGEHGSTSKNAVATPPTLIPGTEFFPFHGYTNDNLTPEEIVGDDDIDLLSMDWVLSADQLKAICRRNGLLIAGKKAEVLKRLVDARAKNPELRRSIRRDAIFEYRRVRMIKHIVQINVSRLFIALSRSTDSTTSTLSSQSTHSNTT